MRLLGPSEPTGPQSWLERDESLYVALRTQMRQPWLTSPLEIGWKQS